MGKAMWLCVLELNFFVRKCSARMVQPIGQKCPHSQSINLWSAGQSLLNPPTAPSKFLESLFHSHLCISMMPNILVPYSTQTFREDLEKSFWWSCVVCSCNEGIWSTHLQNPKTYQNLSQSHSSRTNMDREIAALEWAAMAKIQVKARH